MRFITAVIALAATAAAAPEVKRWPPMDQISVSEANDACGNNLELNCCNKETDQAAGHGDVSKNPGVVGGVLDGLSLFDQCSQLSVAARKLPSHWKYSNGSNIHLSHWCPGPAQVTLHRQGRLLPALSLERKFSLPYHVQFVSY